AVERRLGADWNHDAEHLQLHRAAHRVELLSKAGWPGQDLEATIQADQVLDLLCRREMPPALRQVGDTRHEREGDHAAIVEADALLARSFERRACHRLRYVART